MRKLTSSIFIFSLVFAVVVLALTGSPQTAEASSGADVSTVVGDCGETTVTATNSSSVSNIYLVVEANGVVQYVRVTNDGNPYSLTVGPFFEDTIVYWHVFGGGERDYDQPLWNGYGVPGFAEAINAYAASVGTWNWVIAGRDDPNPFVTWNEIPVEGCPLTKDQCKDDGWMALGFRNQGDCIQLVNTGK